MPGVGGLFSGKSGEEAAKTPLESIPAYADLELKNRNLSPYDLFAANYNPLRPVVTELIDFDRLRAQDRIQLTICATNVLTARRRVFTNKDVSVDALLGAWNFVRNF